MNRTLILATLALVATGGSASLAAGQPQPPAPAAAAVLDHAPKGTVVFDDDGGRAQIVPRTAVESRDATFHGGPVVSGADVQAVFLGSGWRERSNRDKEGQAIAALRDPRDAASPLPKSVKAWEIAGQPLEDPAGDPVANKTISDLEIQGRLESLLGGAGPLDPKGVYVIFLAPGLGSTLGSANSARDFAAYHNHLHSAAGVFHYVVVPYDDDAARWLAAARQSLRQAVINPEGNGWY